MRRWWTWSTMLETRRRPGAEVSEQGELVISKLTAEDVPDRGRDGPGWGWFELLPRLPITELLIEVNRWTGFSGQVSPTLAEEVHPMTTRSSAADLNAAVFGAVYAIFGSPRWPSSTGLTYDKLDLDNPEWYVREETLRVADRRSLPYHQRCR